MLEKQLYDMSRSPRPAGSRPPLTFILPPSAQTPTPNREFLLTTPSEGVSYVATVARNAGWQVELLDMRSAAGLSHEEAVDRAVERGGVVAMPTYVDSYPHNEQLLRMIKERAPGLPTVIGGALVSSLVEPLMRHLEANYAVLHEGELTFLELLDHLEAGGSPQDAAGIQGLSIRDGDGGVHLTGRRAQIQDLDALPIPDLSLYPSVRQDPRVPELGMTTSRGCYGRCTFCFVNIRKIRNKSPGRVGEEVAEFRRKHDVQYMFLNDLTFTADLDRTRAICQVMKASGVTWSCSTRVEAMTPELLRTMAHSGCRDIWYGVESMDQEVLDRNQKMQTVQQIERAMEATEAAGIKVVTNFIIGLPGETEASLEKMIRFIESRAVTPASIKFLTPFPGTAIFDEALRRGIIPDPIAYLRHLAERRVNDDNDEIFNMTDLPEETLRQAFRHITELRARRVQEHFPDGNTAVEAES